MTDSLSVKRHLINRVARALERRGAPRLQMSLIVFVTAASGLIASFLMLKIGIKWMWLRYSLSVLVAYAVFLSLIWCWLALYQKRLSLNSLDLPNVTIEGNPGSPSPFGGGVSGGDDACRSFGTDSLATHMPAASNHTGIIDNPDLSFDADEIVLILIVLGLSLFSVIVGVVMVMSAPTLLGEVLIDGALAGGFYRHLKHIERRNWIESTVRRTWLPVIGLIVFFAITGLIFHWYAPDADSVGDVICQ